jgi:hypothetical protein
VILHKEDESLTLNSPLPTWNKFVCDLFISATPANQAGFALSLTNEKIKRLLRYTYGGYGFMLKSRITTPHYQLLFTSGLHLISSSPYSDFTRDGREEAMVEYWAWRENGIVATYQSASETIEFSSDITETVLNDIVQYGYRVSGRITTKDETTSWDVATFNNQIYLFLSDSVVARTPKELAILYPIYATEI